MGTKLQTKRHLTGYCSIWGPNDSVSNDIWPLYLQDRAPKNCQHYDSFLPQQSLANAYVGYDKEKMKQMILDHESTFRHQLQELHRLYGIQRELMNEFRGRQVKKGYGKVETYPSNTFPSHTTSEHATPKWHVSHTALLHSLVGQISASETSPLSSFRKGQSTPGLFPSRDEGSTQKCEPPSCKSNVLQTRMINLEIPDDVYMNSEGNLLEESVYAFSWFGNCSAASFHGTQKDVKSSFCSINNHPKDDCIRLNSLSERNTELADLNEPIPLEECTSDPTRAPCSLNDVEKVGASANSASSIHVGHKDISLCSVKERDCRMSLSHFQSRNKNIKEQLIIDLGSDEFSKASQDELTKGGEFLPSEQNKKGHHSRRKLFGVEIFEAEDKSLVTDTAFVSCMHKLDSVPSTFEDKVDISSGTISDSRLKKHVWNDNGLSLSSQFDGNLLHGSAMVGCHLSNQKMDRDLSKQSREKDILKPFDVLDCLNLNSKKVFKAATSTSSVLQEQVIPCAEIQTQQNNSEGSFLRCAKSEYCADQSRENKNSYHLNLDSLRDSCQPFFQRTKSNSVAPQISTQKQESTPSHSVEGNEGITKKRTCGLIFNNLSSSEDPTFAGISSKAISKTCDGGNAGNLLINKATFEEQSKVNESTLGERINGSLSGLQHHFDLNFSLIEEEAPSAPSLPSSVLKIATSEIDLEAPAHFDSEAVVHHLTEVESNFSSEGTKDPHEDLLTVAAEAIVAMSSSAAQVNAGSASNEPLEAMPDDCLKWFADVTILCESDDQGFAPKITQSVDGALTKSLIPDGLDYFEFMTLQLEDTNEENYYYKPPTLKNQDDEETKVFTLSRRPRRGQARRVRQRKDFQRDILPGLLTLSKHDVTEDFQTFEELLRASGCDWQSSKVRKTAAKSSRGRRHTRVVTCPSIERNIASAGLEQQPVTREVQVEQKTLTGWGKKTRRLPRQRCVNSSPACQL